MGRKRDDLTEEQTENIRQGRIMRAAGWSWSEIGAMLGVKKHWIRYRLEFDENGRYIHVAGPGRPQHIPLTDAELAERQALIPVDTRTFTQRWFGDPIPGDIRRQHAEALGDQNVR